MKTLNHDTVHRAACGDKQAMQELKQTHSQMEFRRNFDDLNGPKIICRRKNAKIWKTL